MILTPKRWVGFLICQLKFITLYPNTSLSARFLILYDSKFRRVVRVYRYLLVNSQKAMAVSKSFLVSSKLETLLSNPNDPSSSPAPLIRIPTCPMNNNGSRRGLIQRARCEISSSKAASVSALEQLKTSAIDSTSLFLLFCLPCLLIALVVR